jgi:hypothetical protein
MFPFRCAALASVAIMEIAFGTEPANERITFLYTLPITIQNQQSIPTPAPFQQQVIVNSSVYAQYEAANLQNIQFQDDSGAAIPSWIESGNSSGSTQTIYWLKFANGIPANASVTVNMQFAATTQSVFNARTTGEAPDLASSYGRYDTGDRVFSKYTNFAGQNQPSGWYSGVTSGTTIYSTGSVVIHDGASIIHMGLGGDMSFLGSNWNVGDRVAEMHLLSELTSNGQAMAMVCSSSPTQYVWTADEVGYQQGFGQSASGLEVENNDSGTPSVVATASSNPNLPAVIGFQGGTVFANYQMVASVPPPICGGGYLAMATNSGYGAALSFDWVRLRAQPPNGVMPTVSFGAIN